MKYPFLVLTLLALVLNGLAYLVFDGYQALNAVLSSALLAVNGLLLTIVMLSRIKDAFKVSLGILFPVAAFISFVLALFVDGNAKNDGCFFASIAILVVQLGVFAATYYASDK